MGKGAGCEKLEGGMTTEGSEAPFPSVLVIHVAFAVETTDVEICYCMLLFEAGWFPLE